MLNGLSPLENIQNVLKKGLYSIQSVMSKVDNGDLKLAYTPGVGTICSDIKKDPKLVDKYTFRDRSAAIVTDGSLLNTSPKQFMPIMDWLVFQIKAYSGIDAYPFILNKEANFSQIIKNLANSYSAVIYLDESDKIEVPKDILFIRHRKIVELSKCQLTDAKNTANVLGYLKSNQYLGQPENQEYKKRINSTFDKFKINQQPFKWDGNDIDSNARRFHQQYQGKIHIKLAEQKVEDLKQIFSYKNLKELALKNNVSSKTSKVAVIVTDGTSILGLGNIGPRAGLPVMQGKSLIFKKFGEVDVVPFCMNALQNKEEQIQVIKNTVANFMGVNLEDIKAPECFQIQQCLKKMKILPVFHDDQHGTAIVTLAALINALKVAKKQVKSVKVVINGAGAAGVTIAKLFKEYGVKNMIVCDTKGAIYQGRKEGMNETKNQIATFTNIDKQEGSLQKMVEGADVFVGVSSGGALKGEWVKTMKNPIIFALANPEPQISADEAKKNGAFIYGSGRNDYQNQINNSLVFPGIFKGIKQHNIKQITMKMKLRAAQALAKSLKKQPSVDFIIPGSFDGCLSCVIADQIGKQVQK